MSEILGRYFFCFPLCILLKKPLVRGPCCVFLSVFCSHFFLFCFFFFRSSALFWAIEQPCWGAVKLVEAETSDQVSSVPLSLSLSLIEVSRPSSGGKREHWRSLSSAHHEWCFPSTAQFAFLQLSPVSRKLFSCNNSLWYIPADCHTALLSQQNLTLHTILESGLGGLVCEIMGQISVLIGEKLLLDRSEIAPSWAFVHMGKDLEPLFLFFFIFGVKVLSVWLNENVV